MVHGGKEQRVNPVDIQTVVQNSKFNHLYDECRRYFVVDHKNHSETQWWNSQVGQTGQIDFTKSAAAQWYTERLRKLQRESGIDSFKFDAGETSWSPPVSSAIERNEFELTF